jgi:hypothetical protein
MPSIFYVALPAVWLVLVEQIIKRGKLVVSGGVTRGRVARDVIGVTTPKEMTPHAQAQKPTQSGTRNGNRNNREGGLSPFWRTN